MTNGLSRETHHHLLLILILILFFFFFFLPSFQQACSQTLLFKEQLVYHLLFFFYIIILSSTPQFLDACWQLWGLIGSSGLKPRTFFLRLQRQRLFRLLPRKLCLKILITNKNRINETLKNPEKSLFEYVFCLFLPLFQHF